LSGIYIHVPFCKTRCIYCDFFTGTNLKHKSLYAESVCKEIELRSGYLNGEVIDTIYFGGGTPSQLTRYELETILQAIQNRFIVSENAEITLEANPDDLDIDYLSMLIELGFNRLSVGIQSFDNSLLRFLNRRHSAEKAIDAINTSRECGFQNISIDLMYGLPGQTMNIWKDSLDIAINLGIQHISSYHLIYEEGTELYRRVDDGNIKVIDEELSLEMFSEMIDKLTVAGFVHYEISNFGKEGFFSRHNSSYWLGKKYLGLGPAAHSYNGDVRSWNLSSLSGYIKGVQTGILSIEKEILDLRTRYNDFILTGMRTMWGINEEKLEKLFGFDMLQYFKKNIEKHIKSGKVIYANGIYKLSRQGIFISDSIMSDLMKVDL